MFELVLARADGTLGPNLSRSSLDCTTAPVGPPAQLGVYTDGNGFSAIDRFTGDRGSIAYLDWLPSALPYHLLLEPSVIVLGSGAGSDVLRAHSSRRATHATT